MSELEQTSNLLRLFRPEELLGDRPYLLIERQILFFDEETGSYVITQVSDEEEYTATDYQLLPEGAPFELIQQKLIYMASPEEIHQKIASNLHLEIGYFVKQNKLGEVRFAPLDVHFDSENVFQPDLLFISVKRQSIIKRWIMGAPDFVVEITSGSTEKYDRNQKMEVYGKHRVVEYWIVRPVDEKIEVYHNEEQSMKLVQEAGKSDTIVSKAIEGFSLHLKRVFE